MNNPFPTVPITSEVRILGSKETSNAAFYLAASLSALDSIKELKDKKKILTERKKEILQNNEALAQAEKEAERYVEAVKIAKERAMATEEYSQVELEMKEVNTEIKTYGDAVDTQLFEYSKLTGRNEIVDGKGKVLKIKHKVQVKYGQLRLF